MQPLGNCDKGENLARTFLLIFQLRRHNELPAQVPDLKDVVQPHLHLPMKVIWGEDGNCCLQPLPFHIQLGSHAVRAPKEPKVHKPCPEVSSVLLLVAALLTSVLPPVYALSSAAWLRNKCSRGFSSTGHQLLINCFPGDQLLPLCHAKRLGCLHRMALPDTGERTPSQSCLLHSEKHLPLCLEVDNIQGSVCLGRRCNKETPIGLHYIDPPILVISTLIINNALSRNLFIQKPSSSLDYLPSRVLQTTPSFPWWFPMTMSDVGSKNILWQYVALEPLSWESQVLRHLKSVSEICDSCHALTCEKGCFEPGWLCELTRAALLGPTVSGRWCPTIPLPALQSGPSCPGPGEGWPVPFLLTELQIQPSGTQGRGGRMGRVGNSISSATCVSSAAQTTEDK
ncbi:uncharacterized protein LOC141930281 [Strix aluco]|uniref:uncharacterized protein LOC141930281 n=1 Tax=Strix aluco TaxID=111821 RepID=UPI003DA26FF8